MEIIIKPVSELTPYKANAKKHDKTQVNNVAESIKQYGFVQPVVVDKDNVVVIGHCRLLAAKQLKMKEVPCVCVDDLTEEQVKALRIVDNKSNESEWDFDLLADELGDLDLSGFDFEFPAEEDTENNLAGGEITKKEIEPYKYIHYLVTIDVNDHDKFISKIEELEKMGATVAETRNNT